MVVVCSGPGQGITLADGTLVFPTRDVMRKEPYFPNITYSKDHGKNLDDQ